ncbi:DinB family protein [Paenibacillus herberti]|uniref:DinB-like domain-containing protein n=1 Tax=Paenibacillus herberti TaxID=1619309 RepID=A0A229P286_9BACL|nr:DinB family protein [Paenibacillus herberti]OXM16161.1 hypothetical protein CGZ75_05535 [Paenibacillus herberti]
MSREKTKLLEKAWEYAYETEDWSPPLKMALQDVTEEQADWRPQGAASNTIRETVHHLIYYKEKFLQKSGHKPDGITNTDTFQAAAIRAENASWDETRDRLAAAHAGIASIIREWSSDEDYDRELTENYTAGQWVSSLANHDAYHIGQIVLLRKLQGTWAATRSFQ